MAISNLLAENASAVLETKRGTVTVTHVSELKNGGKPLEIPVGALQAVEWDKEPKAGQVKMRNLRLRFRNELQVPPKMDVGLLRAASTPANVEFVDALRLAVAEAKPKPEWQQPVDSDQWNALQARRGRWKIVALVVLATLLFSGMGFGIYYTKKHTGASHQASVVMENLSLDQKQLLFHNFLLTKGIKGSVEDEYAAAKTVCRQFDKGASLTEVGIAMLTIDNGMTTEQKGLFIGSAVAWWCPQHQPKMNEKIDDERFSSEQETTSIPTE